MRKLLITPSFFTLICISVLVLLVRHQDGHALRNDPALHGLCGADCQTSGLPVLGANELLAFEGLTRAYGLVMAPLVLSPANTMGINATEAEFSFSSVILTDDASTWVNATNSTVVPSNLSPLTYLTKELEKPNQ